MNAKIIHNINIDYVEDNRKKQCMRIICSTCQIQIVQKHFKHVGDGISMEWNNLKHNFQMHPNYEFWSEFNK